MKKSINQKQVMGFSIPEVLIVMSVMIGLYLLATSNLFAPQRTNTVVTTIDTLLSDMSAQQNRSMTGDISNGSVNTAYGVYFQSDRYTMFKGISYSSGNSENFTITLNPNIRFSSISIPNSQVVFATGTGAFLNYGSGQNIITLQDSSASINKTIHINSNGIVDSVN